MPVRTRPFLPWGDDTACAPPLCRKRRTAATGMRKSTARKRNVSRRCGKRAAHNRCAFTRRVGPLRRLAGPPSPPTRTPTAPAARIRVLTGPSALTLDCALCALQRHSAGCQGGDQGRAPSRLRSQRPGSPRPDRRRRAPLGCSGPCPRTERGVEQPEQDGANRSSGQSRRRCCRIHHAHGQGEPRVVSARCGQCWCCQRCWYMLELDVGRCAWLRSQARQA